MLCIDLKHAEAELLVLKDRVLVCRLHVVKACTARTAGKEMHRRIRSGLLHIMVMTVEINLYMIFLENGKQTSNQLVVVAAGRGIDMVMSINDLPFGCALAQCIVQPCQFVV